MKIALDGTACFTQYARAMHTVAETKAFCRQAYDAGMSEDEIADLVDYIAANPTAGDEIPGTGGCRKLRWPGKGKGKRGGLRTITFFSGEQMPVFLVTVFAKGEKVTLTEREKQALAVFTKTLVAEYAAKVVSMKRKIGRTK